MKSDIPSAPKQPNRHKPFTWEREVIRTCFGDDLQYVLTARTDGRVFRCRIAFPLLRFRLYTSPRSILAGELLRARRELRIAVAQHKETQP